jgi:hypothetical protein
MGQSPLEKTSVVQEVKTVFAFRGTHRFVILSCQWELNVNADACGDKKIRNCLLFYLVSGPRTPTTETGSFPQTTLRGARVVPYKQ